MIGVEIAQGAVAFAACEIGGHVGAAIDQDIRLELAELLIDLVVLPGEGSLVMLAGGAFAPLGALPIAAETEPVLLAAVEPEDIELAIVGEQLLYLAVILVAHGVGAGAL